MVDDMLPIVRRDPRHLWAAGTISSFVVLWEVLGRLNVNGIRVLPPPSAIIRDYVTIGDIYVTHIAATVATASYGFMIGSVTAFVAAILFCISPKLERLCHGLNITFFAVPPIAIGPLLVLVLGGSWPEISLAAIMLYFPTMATMLVGLREIDSRHIDLVRAYGGGDIAIMRFVRLRSALPAIFAGLRVAASLAVLGAILGEFGSGQRWGLGTFLLGSLGGADAARIWGIAIASAAIALAGYGLFSFLASRVTGTTIPVTLSAGRAPDQISSGGVAGHASDILLTVLSAAFPFLVWWLLLKISGLSPIIAPGPAETFSYLFLPPTSDEAQPVLLSALMQTVPLAVLAVGAGIIAAFMLASLSVLAPKLLRGLLPVAMVLQNTPLVALTPIILLLLGRSIAACLAMAVLVVFFPAFVMLQQGFALVPRAALETVQVYGGDRFKQLRLISVPYAMPYLIAATKLVVPRALLGVMVAEWLLTGTGLGNLMDASRGTLDYGMVWSSAVVSIIVAVGGYQLVGVAERHLLTPKY
jgi:sulfonate transport system permease protein